MRQLFSLTVPGGNTHTLPLRQLEALQAVVAGLGAETYPLMLRLGGSLKAQLQPVTSRALLAEIEDFLPRLTHIKIPCLLFRDAAGQELGGLYGSPEPRPGAVTGQYMNLVPTTDGIRLVLRQMPPPVGFRSHPDLPSGLYECYFQRISHGPEGCQGIRTEAMGGSGAPVALPELSLPPLTRWDFARTAGKPAVALVESLMAPAPEVYRDLLHGLESACNESLRLKAPLRMRRE